MRPLLWTRCAVLLRPAIASALLMAAGCSTATTPPPPPTVPAQTNSQEPLACSELPPLVFHPGKPGATVQDVLEALKQPSDPLGWARGVLGDTKSTRLALSDYTARRQALGCQEP